MYWLNVVSFIGSVTAVFLLSPYPPEGTAARPGWRSVGEGLKFAWRTPPVLGAYLIDVNAMVFGLPRALFPALALTAFGGGATTVGLLYAAWGAAITGFGLVRWLPLGLLFLAIAGWADVISAVFRNTIIQFAGPDDMRGRLMGVQMAVVTGGPRIGDLYIGIFATAVALWFPPVLGGILIIALIAVLVRVQGSFRAYDARTPTP